MSNLKYIEIRDVGTFIPAIAIKLVPNDISYEEERYLLKRSGYSLDNDEPAVMLVKLNSSAGRDAASYDPYSWKCSTMMTAHNFIEKNFDSIRSGDVVDVEYINGHSSLPKVSERVSDLSGI